MRTKWASMLLLLALFFCAQTAHAFFDPPYITPPDPVAGEPITVSIRAGVCDAIGDREGYPIYSQVGNAIHITYYGAHVLDSEQCIFGTGTATFPVGAYPAGDYTLTLDLDYLDGFGHPSNLPLGVINFTVAGIAPPPNEITSVPTIGVASGLLTAVLLALFGAIVFRRRGLVVFVGLSVACAFTAEPAHAQAAPQPANLTIEFVLTTAAGAPSAATVVGYYNTSPRTGPVPLHAFTIKNPQTVQYLIPDRATGDFLAWQGANPNSVRTKLEQTMLASFLTAADVATALSALQSDPYVANAYAVSNITMSSAQLTNFDVISTSTAPDQYGRDEFNIDAAWQLAGGYAAVSVLDNGLYQLHPQFVQFDPTSHAYVGGNFVNDLSKDVSYTGTTPPSGYNPLNVDEAAPLNPPSSSCASQIPVTVGHGTHVAGLLAASDPTGFSVRGTCEHCGIAMWKIASAKCLTLVTPHDVEYFPNPNAAWRAFAQATDTGSQIISFSGGTPYGGASNYCQAYVNYSECRAIAYASSRDVAIVAASGNNRTDINFPASDARVVAAGGFQLNGDDSTPIWD